MSANIGQMMYAGNEVPWHGLGKKVDANLTAEEAIVAAGLDWQVGKAPVIFENELGIQHTMDSRYVVYRKDNNVGLGVVGQKHTDVQNKQCFSIMDAIVGEKLASYHTAGYLGNGERIWMLMQTPGIIRVAGDDVIEKFILLATSHDGTLSLSILFTPIRVVCQNTLNAALSGKQDTFRARHTESITARISNIQEIRDTLGIISNQYSYLEELSQRLASRQATGAFVDQFLKDLFQQKQGDEISTRTKNRMDSVDRLFQYGRGNQMPQIKGSLWALYNGAVEYADYENGKDPVKRAQSTLFGAGSMLKARAMALVSAAL